MYSSDVTSNPAYQDPLWLLPRILNKLYTMWLGATYPFASWGRKSSFHYTAEIWRNRAHRIKIGNYVHVCKDVRFSASVPPGEKGDPTIIIDDYCAICPRVHISAKNLVHIERDVIVSASALIMDHSHAYEDITLPVAAQDLTTGGRIRIGQGSWIGQGAAIVCTKGELVLGRNCVVGANSVVTRSFPPYSVISGIPARVVKQYDPVKGIWVLGSSGPAVNSSEAKRELVGSGPFREA
jgi:acetyltransferase-like isoleucine patch superfamily enzyme